MGLFGKKKKAAQDEAAQLAEQAQQAADAAGYQGPPVQVPGQVPGQPQPYVDPSQWNAANAAGQQVTADWQQAVAAGANPADPAVLGGPSAAPVGPDDAIWQPIHGISVDHYAQIVKYAQMQGIQDEYSIAQFAQQHYGIAAETWNAAVAGWVERMGQSMAVGQRFRQVYDAT